MAVIHPAGRVHLEIRKDRVLGVKVGDRVLLVDGTLDATMDLIFVGGAPVTRGRNGSGGLLLLPGDLFGPHEISRTVH